MKQAALILLSYLKLRAIRLITECLVPSWCYVKIVSLIKHASASAFAVVHKCTCGCEIKRLNEIEVKVQLYSAVHKQ